MMNSPTSDAVGSGSNPVGHRQVHITKIPSSALFLHGLKSAANIPLTQLLTVKIGAGIDHIRFSQVAINALQDTRPSSPSSCANLLTAKDDPTVFVVVGRTMATFATPTTAELGVCGLPPTSPVGGDSPSVEGTDVCPVPTEEQHSLDDALAQWVKAVQPSLAGPADRQRFEIVMDRHGGPGSSKGGATLLETLKVKEGQESSFNETCSVELAALWENLPDDSFSLQVLSNAKEPQLFVIMYHAVSENYMSAVRASEKWQKWRRTLTPLLDGASKMLDLIDLGSSENVDEVETTPSTPSMPTPAASSASGVTVSGGDVLEFLARDPRLASFTDFFEHRLERFNNLTEGLIASPIAGGATSLVDVAGRYMHFGVHRTSRQGQMGWFVREWLPNAKHVALMGDFNGWSRESHILMVDDATGSGNWTLFLPDLQSGIPAIEHKCKLRLHVVGENDESFDRIPAWINLAWQSPDSGLYDGVAWNPPMAEKYEFKNAPPPRLESPRVYEAHVGTSHWDPRVGTYDDFRVSVLPRIRRLGYNTLLLLGVCEHDYFASFGWHVTSYFAPSSRSGTPDELKHLIDDAHGAGIQVWISLVHSHASPSSMDGLVMFDGSDGCYFRDGVAGHQREWDARIFDFGKYEVIRFLLSNIRYYIQEFKFDGIRLEGVESMMYHHHFIGRSASSMDMNDHFSFEADQDGQAYLMMANSVAHALGAVTVASDRSMAPTLCTPIEEGGIGFDFRMDVTSPAKILEFLQGDADETRLLEPLVRALEQRPEKTLVTTEMWNLSLVAKRPMKIAMFAWETLHTHFVGGVAPHVTELAAGLCRLGHEIHIFTRSTGNGSAHNVHYGVHYHECAFNLDRDFVNEMGSMCSSLFHHMRQSELFMDDKFAICHAHDWLAAQCLNSTKGLGRTSVLTMHSTEYGRCGNNAYGGQSGRIRDVEQRGCGAADRIVCVSGVLADEVKRFYSVHDQKIKVIYNGINATNYDGFEDAAPIKARYGIGPMQPCFVFVGRLAVQKGPDLLIEAIPHVLKFRGDSMFVIVGDGHMRGSLEQRTHALGIAGSVRFLGSKGGAELKSLCKACDALVVPSRNEPFGIVVLEAWACYKPVVATTCGGPRDFVSPNVDGVLVDPEPGSIAWGCCEILKNFEHARWMGGRGRAKAAFSFSWDKIAQQTRDVYYELHNKHDAPYGIEPCNRNQGEGSLAFKMIGARMYDSMSVFDPNDVVARGLALHKIMRLLVISLGGAGYSNFMGNEFAHPEFIDMPRAGNNFSHHHARRRWDLADDTALKFKHFEFFDACLQRLEDIYNWLSSDQQPLIFCHEDDKVVAFERGKCLFVVNLHPTKSYDNYQIGHSFKEGLVLELDTDEGRFGGWNRLHYMRGCTFPSAEEGAHAREASVCLNLPSRTGLMLVSATAWREKKMDTILAIDQVDDFILSLKSFKGL